MNVYFDTEFTGLHKGTTLISIGLIASNGKKFYAEIIDYDRSQVDDWIKENVINNLWAVSKTVDECSKHEYYHLGTKKEIAKKLKDWFLGFDSIQLVSDVAHFDMVLLIDLFGGAFDLPKNINPSCHDINQDIARFLGITEREAFDVSRECFLGICLSSEKHNALYDAEIIKEIYEFISN